MRSCVPQSQPSVLGDICQATSLDQSRTRVQTQGGQTLTGLVVMDLLGDEDKRTGGDIRPLLCPALVVFVS